MEEAFSGVKGELAVKLYGEHLRMLSTKAKRCKPRCLGEGVEDLGIFRIHRAA